MRLKEIIKNVLLWRLATIFVSLLAIPLIPFRSGFSFMNGMFRFGDVFTMWANFDGVMYVDIAKWGYGIAHHTDKNYAFFPIYPWVVRLFAFTQDYISSGLFVSHLCFILALFILYKLLLLDFPAKISRLSIFLLILFPTSFFFGSVYTESLFLLITVLSFYSMRKKYIFLSLLLACIASATRVTGIILLPALLIEYYIQNKKDLKKFINPDLIWFILSPVGLLSYMRFQFQKTGDALYFVNSQPNFGSGRVVEKVILLHQVIFRYIKMMIFVDHFSATFFTAALEFLVGVTFLILLFFAYKKLRPSYFIYCLLSYLIPTVTGTFLSMPRFVLVLFPMFAVIAQLLSDKPPIVKKVYFAINIFLGIICIALFTRGYFVG